MLRWAIEAAVEKVIVQELGLKCNRIEQKSKNKLEFNLQ